MFCRNVPLKQLPARRGTPIPLAAVLLLPLLLAALGGCSAATRRDASGAPGGEPATMRVAALRPAAGDLAGLRVVDRVTGAVFHVYHDSVSAATAHEAVARLHWIHEAVAELMGADPGLVHWGAVAFVADSDYTPPRTGREVRWHVETDAAGRLTAESAKRLVSFIPHEQAHAVHATFTTEVPRWFSEGLASWVELQVAERLDPAVAADVRALHAGSARAEPADLRGWGGVSVRREAILRQVSPEQRERMDRDPSYMPPGPFRFAPEDMVTDLANEEARYVAALRVFEGIEQIAGIEGLQRWLRAIWARGGAWRTRDLVELASQLMGVDLGPQLR